MALTYLQESQIDSSSNGFMRNRIINGEMRIDQRYVGAAVTIPAATSTYTIDRWIAYGTAASKFTCQQTPSATETGYATRVGAGFTNYLAMVSAAATTPAATDIYFVGQKIEGFNIADLAWGSASAKTVTLSFWVNSSVAGTYGGSLLNTAGSRSYVFSYTINSTNTWEQKTITISGDTTGTWVVNNGIGIQLYFDMGTGTTYKGTAGSWSGSLYYGATGGTNLIATSGATFYITGVQLEAGSVATPFERRMYSTELSLCQRYYQKTYGQSFAPGAATTLNLVGFPICGNTGTDYTSLSFILPMRAAPSSISLWDGNGNANAFSRYIAGAWSHNTTSAITSANIGENGFSLSYTGTPFTMGTPYSVHYAASAEL